MERLTSLAKRLGEAIAEHERCTALKEARTRFEADEEAKKLQKEYDEAAAALREKMAAGRPLEPEEKRREAELRTAVARNESLSALLKAQVDFHDLMQRVNEALEKAIEL